MKGAKSGIRWGVSLLAAGLLGGLVFSLAGRPAGSSPGRFDFDLAQTVSQAAEGGGDAGASAAGRDKGFSRPFIASARAVMPAVVHIEVTQRAAAAGNEDWNQFEDDFLKRFFGQPGGPGRPMRPAPEERLRRGQGSGVIVDPSGIVVTNNHVIENMTEVKVALADKREFEADIVLRDPRTDLAVLRLKGTTERFVAVEIGDSDQVEVGDVVLAIGNPFGVGQTVTMGIVSALGRSHLGINTFENFIQTDAAINPGNSGGALVDINGNLVGINTAIYSRTGGSLGIGFAIPVSSAKNIMEQIIQHGAVTRGWIGVEAQEITPELAESFGLPDNNGVLIAGVVRGSPAESAGFRPGDVLLTVGAKPVTDPQVMLDLIAALKPEERAPFRLRRDKSLIDLQVKVGKRPSMRADQE